MRDSVFERSDRAGGLRFTFLALAVLFALGPAVTFAESTAPTLREMGHGFALTDAQLDELARTGTRVGGKLDSVSENELVVAVAAITSRDLDWHWDRAIAGLSPDPAVMELATIGDDPSESLGTLTLPDAEVDRLAAVEAGPDANFSTEEIAALRKIADANEDEAARRRALMQGFREILAERVTAYRTGGLGAAAPYDRAGGEGGSPAGQLERALGELRVTRRLAPDVYDAMASFPAPVPEGVVSRFRWVLHTAGDRAVFALSHLVFGRVEGGIVGIDRRFYVNHTLNSMQAVVVMMPNESGKTVLFYANRTGTDVVLGFGSSIARSIGRTVMSREVDGLITAYREFTEGSDGR